MTDDLPTYDAHNHAHELVDTGTLARCVVNGTSPDDWGAVAAFAAGNEQRVTASFGLHPWFIGDAPDDWASDLRRRVADDPAAGVGECGLDKTRRSPSIEVQAAVFEEQIRIAREFDRVLSVHCVRAWGRLLEVIKSEALPGRGVLLHSFCAPLEMVRDFVALEGLYFSLCFAGKVSPDQELARALPPGRILIESDASGENGRVPAYVVGGHAALAEIVGEPVEVVATQVRQNFDRLFLPARR